LNSLLILPEEVLEEGGAVLTGARAARACHVHDLKEGITVSAAILGGNCGTALINVVTAERVELSISTPNAPPERTRISLVVGICRPQTVKKVIHAATCFGINELHFVRTAQAQKSYLDSEVLTEAAILDQQILALEQSGDSVLPPVKVHRRFRPFVEDTLAGLSKTAMRLVALAPPPGAGQEPVPFGPATPDPDQPVWLVIGGEAGFNEFEEGALCSAGFERFSLGSRVLRVEQAVLVAMGAIEQARKERTPRAR
jgi:RsmE family RNA methyltransferase